MSTVEEEGVVIRTDNDSKSQSKRGGEGDAGSRAGEGKEWVTINFLITRVTFREIALLGSGVSMKTLSVMAILNGLRQLAAT